VLTDDGVVGADVVGVAAGFELLPHPLRTSRIVRPIAAWIDLMR
jgi:hypothetical protein